MRKNNKGFTLTELIVAIAILGVVTLGAYGFMAAGSRSYRSVSTVVNLQTAAQQTMGQIQEVILDCNCGIYTDGASVYLLDRGAAADGTTEYTMHVYSLDAGSHEINYQRVTGVTTVTPTTEITDAAKHLLSGYATAFSATQQTENNRVSSLTLQFTFQQDTKEYQATQTVALRNLPTACPNLGVLLALAK